MADSDQGPRRRDYVVMQQVKLRELMGALLPNQDFSAELADAVENFDLRHELLIKIAVVEATRNAEQAMKEAGHAMVREEPDKPAIVPAIAVPATQWTTAPVHLTPRLDVEVRPNGDA